MINNLNIMLPEIFLSLSIFSVLMIGVFIKNSSNLIFNLTLFNNYCTISIILSNPHDEEKIFLNSFITTLFFKLF